MARLFCCNFVGNFRQASMVKPLWWIISRNLVLILVYYFLSIGLTFYQNSLLKRIHFPLIVVMTHLVVKFVMASSLRLTNELWTKKHRVLLDCDVWVKTLSLVGISGGLDIGLSNWSQERITVSLYTMTKSTAIIFILGFALAFKLEEKHWSLMFIVAMISSGLFMFTYKSTQFELEGFLLVIAASFLSGLRWSTTQLVVQKTKLGLQNPIDMVYHVQPWMIVAVLPFAAFFEGPQLIHQQSIAFDTPEEQSAVLRNVAAILIGAIMAFSMELAEYLVITYTSSLTFAVAGIFKEICTLCLAVIFNGDQMTFINFIGLLTCLIGIICHVVFKFQRSAKEMAKSKIQNVNQISPNDHGSPLSPPRQVVVKRTQLQEKSIMKSLNQETIFHDDDDFKLEDNLPLLRNYNRSNDPRTGLGSDDDSDEDENVIWRA